jgi:PAB-dependent poly(A)-specific ribonuclease subunit 3
MLYAAPAPGLNLPEEPQGYHTLVPLKSTIGERKRFSNWNSTIYCATGKDKHRYMLRHVEST